MTKKYENQSNFQESRPEIREEEISWQIGLYSGKDSLANLQVFINYFKSSKTPN